MQPARPLILVVALAAWVSCDTPVAPGDGGPDAAAADAAPDVGPHDVGPSDSGTADPEWVSIAVGLPDFCRLERANHPERLDQLRVRFSPCSSRSNCQVSSVIESGDWYGSDGTYAVGTVTPDDWTWIFVSPTDGGPPIAAYRGGTRADPMFCGLGFGAIGGGRFAMGTSYSSGGVEGASFFVAPLSDAGRIDRAFLDDRTHFRGAAFVQGLFVSDTALVAWDSAGFFVDLSTGSFIRLYDSAGMAGAVEDDPSVVGNAVMFVNYETSSSAGYIVLGHAGVPGGYALYRAPTGVDIARPVTDGIDVGWAQFPLGSTTTPPELWTARFVEDPTAFAPTFVRVIDTVYHPRVGDGLWVDFDDGPNRFEIIDLHGGGRRTYAMPDDIAGRQLLHVSSHRVLYNVGSQLVQFDPSLLPYDDEPDAGTDASIDDAGVDAGDAG